MKYIKWTPEEREAILQFIVMLCKERHIRLDETHYLLVLNVCRRDDLGWRARPFQARHARDWITEHKARVHALVEGSVTYAVPGFDKQFTVQELIDTLAQREREVFDLHMEVTAKNLRIDELEAKLKEKEKQTPPTPAAPITPIATRPQKLSEPCSHGHVALRPKPRVAIAGVHNKHRDRIQSEFPHIDIRWIEPRDNDSLIKSKASGRPAIACTHGTNGKVLRLLHNVSHKCFEVGGASGVRDTLATASL